MRFVSAAARGFRRGAAVAGAAIPALLRDLVGIAGATSIVYGIWQIYQPAAYIAGGTMLSGAALLLARRASPRPQQDNA